MTADLTAGLAALTGTAGAGLGVAIAAFLRVAAAMALLPAFGERMVPARIRLVLALCFAAILFPVTADVWAGLDTPPGLGRLVLTETLAGLAIGVALRLFVLALQTAGTIAAQATSLAQLFGGASVEPQPAISHLLVVSALALAVMAGLHVRLAELFILSYALFPLGGLPDAGDLAGWGTGRIAQAFSLAFVLSAPFVVGSLIYNLALGVINRAMPQLMVAFVGAPAITAGALILLALAAPAMLLEWHRQFGDFLADPASIR